MTRLSSSRLRLLFRIARCLPLFSPFHSYPPVRHEGRRNTPPAWSPLPALSPNHMPRVLILSLRVARACFLVSAPGRIVQVGPLTLDSPRLVFKQSCVVLSCRSRREAWWHPWQRAVDHAPGFHGRRGLGRSRQCAGAGCQQDTRLVRLRSLVCGKAVALRDVPVTPASDICSFGLPTRTLGVPPLSARRAPAAHVASPDVLFPASGAEHLHAREPHFAYSASL